MKNSIRILIVAGLFTGLAGLSNAQEPVFRLKDLNNQYREYGELKGEKLTVIDVWATWCQPCVRSIPRLNELAKEYKNQGVKFIGISVDGPRNQAKVMPFIRSMGVVYPVLRDINNEVMSELNITVVPTLLIYDREGEQVYFHEGYRPGDEDIIEEQIINDLKK